MVEHRIGHLEKTCDIRSCDEIPSSVELGGSSLDLFIHLCTAPAHNIVEFVGFKWLVFQGHAIDETCSSSCGFVRSDENSSLLGRLDGIWSHHLHGTLYNQLASILRQGFHVVAIHLCEARTVEDVVAGDVKHRLVLIILGSRTCNDISPNARTTVRFDLPYCLEFGSIKPFWLVDDTSAVREGDGDASVVENLLSDGNSSVLTTSDQTLFQENKKREN